MPSTAIVRPPRSIEASYNSSEHFTHLRAAGDIDVRNDRGNSFTGWYDLRWYQRGVLNRNEAAVLNFHNMLREAIPGIDEA